MLIERGVRVMNFEAVSDAYAIASNYLRKTGAIADSPAPDEKLLEIIVKMVAKNRDDRYADTNALRAAIAKAQKVSDRSADKTSQVNARF